MKPIDIAIAGCGPAGLASALLLHRDGHRVTVFERFDTPRPIGSGLMIQPTGLAVLRELGLERELTAHGAPIARLFGQAVGSGRTVLDVRYAHLGRQAGEGWGLHRAALFAILHDAAVAEGIPIRTGRAMTGVEPGEGGRRRLVFEGGGTEGPFDLVVDALGTRTPLAPPAGRDLAYGALWTSLDWPEGAGFDAAALEQRYRAASVMAGVLPMGTAPYDPVPKAALFWSLRADRLEAWRARGLTAWKDEALGVWPALGPLLDQIDDPGQMIFARYAHRTLKRPGEPGMIHVGDAWHSASPQLGQGANMALLDAWALAAALRAEDEVADAIAHAVRLRRWHVTLYQAMTDLFTPVYQSDSRILPVLRDRLAGPLSRLWPATGVLAALVSGLIGGPLGRLGLRRVS
ncbi:FAD-dependent monooxygenase [Glycocaulis profundi]|nr:FAD-dependent monooxygenase [Glycocaulis profundi]